MQSTVSRSPWGHPVVVALLALILLALLGIQGMLIWGRSGSGGGEQAAGHRQAGSPGSPATPSVSPKPEPPPPPKPVGNPERVRNVLQPGKTYETTMKMGMAATVIDKDWGIRKTCHLNYVFESRVRRTVKHNDGKTVQVEYYVVECRAVKLLSQAQVRFDLGPLGVSVLRLLDQWFLKGAGERVIEAPLNVLSPILDAIAQQELARRGARVKAMVDSLEKKKCLITYVDGEGVTEIRPIDCELTEEERLYLEGLSILADCYFLPDLQSRPGTYWDVDAHALMDFLPPSWRGRPRGKVTRTREEDYKVGEAQYALLKIRSGSLEIDATDATRHRLGSLTPRGELHYNITAGFVEKGELTAKGHIEDVSRDHLLFEARFESTPHVEIEYYCQILGESGGTWKVPVTPPKIDLETKLRP